MRRAQPLLHCTITVGADTVRRGKKCTSKNVGNSIYRAAAVVDKELLCGHRCVDPVFRVPDCCTHSKGNGQRLEQSDSAKWHLGLPLDEKKKKSFPIRFFVNRKIQC